MRIHLSVLVAAVGCRPQPATAPRAHDPVVLVSPDSGPSPLQQHLAALEPRPGGGDTAALDGKLDAFFARTNAHRGYIAVDKPLYQPGETIWFRLFDLRSADLTAGEADVATIKLVSPRGQSVVEKIVAIEQGNDLELPPGSPGGEYKVVAETKHGAKTERTIIVASYEAPRLKKKLEFVRKAYGPGDTVTATVELHRATGEPIAQRSITGLAMLDGAELSRTPVVTDKDGNAVVQFPLPAQIHKGDGLLTILVDDGGVTESVQKRIPITLHDISLALYPEGGDLVAGLPGRVYFAAKTPLDKPADIEGRVVDEHGTLVALLRSYHDGMGRFELQPDAGAHYHVEITRPVGVTQHFDVPAAKPDGCALQAIDDFQSARPEMRVALWCTRSQDLAVTGVLREKRVATRRIAVTGGEAAIVALPMPPGVQGAVRVTAFDEHMAPVAERLVYRSHGADLKIALVADKASYHPRDHVKVAVQTTGPDGKPVAADLAVSAVDDTVLAFADDKQATLLARLYLEAEMPGQKIEEPNFYFGTDKQAPAALDLVLGTQGWRRFVWKPVFEAPPEKPIDDSWKFAGIGKPHKVHHGKLRKKATGAKPAEPEDVDGVPDDDDRKPVVAAKPERRPIAAVPPQPAPAPDVAAEAERPMAPMAKPMAEPAAMLDEEMVVEGRAMAGEAIMIRQANKNFGVGGDPQLRKHQIRGARDAVDETIVDPMCCAVPERQFPAPSYTARYDGPRNDFRETIAWQSHLVTGADGKGELAFYLSDAVTSFKVTAEGAGGGRLGHGELLVQSKKPVSLAVKLPLEVSAGDHLRLPVTIANETDQAYTAELTATFGKAFAVRGGALAPKLELAPNERRSTFYELDVVGDDDGKVAIGVSAANLHDDIERTIKVVPAGFPQQVSLAGTLSKTAHHEIVISDALPNTLHGSVLLYPSPLATMVKGTEAMIAEPGGCFEQASSTNYPNIMILGYLEENRAAEPAIVERAHTALDHGYKLLTGYETKTRGYEWFGGDPGHEALTAYGLMEFRDMAKVYGDVDKAMVDRTREWLRGRRDGNGGFQRNTKQLDSFGGASAEVTDAYITYALSEAGEKDLSAELGKQRRSAASTKDPYLLALATKVLEAQAPKDDATRNAIDKLVGLQAKDGSYPGAEMSITRSGGDALTIETTALAAMALIAAGPERAANARKAIEWLTQHRDGSGSFGSTQSTVLALKALTAYAKEMRKTQASGTVTLVVNGREVQKVAFEKGHQGAIELAIAEHLKPGKNTIDITLDSTEELPYSGLVQWSSKVPAGSDKAKVRIATQLAASTVKLGEGVHMDVDVANITDAGIPMTLARVGLPGGLTFQTWQLQELRDKQLIDFYETRPREVILYFRSLGPKAKRHVPLELMPTVPGTFTAPASRAYLYYTNEHKHWVEPTTITVVP